jgi:hypothetical protein
MACYLVLYRTFSYTDHCIYTPQRQQLASLPAKTAMSCSSRQAVQPLVQLISRRTFASTSKAPCQPRQSRAGADCLSLFSLRLPKRLDRHLTNTASLFACSRSQFPPTYSKDRRPVWPTTSPAAAFSTSSRRSVPPTTTNAHPDQSAPHPPPDKAINPAQSTAILNSEASQTATDWSIILKLATHIWPRNSPKTKIRVLAALALLVGGKILNVQVPFFFKDIVDALNVPITDGSTVWVLAGASIAGCESWVQWG